MADGARGVFFAIVGPSGAGKDTLIVEARRHLASDARFHFARRTITRPADAGGEEHRPASPGEFAMHEAAGGFALCWRAHGLAYGVPADIDMVLARGRHVVVNLSRTVLAEAGRRYAPFCVLHVTAPAEVLRARLAARQREDERAQAARFERAAPIPGDVRVIEIVNDATVAAGAVRLLDALQTVAANGAR